MKNNVQCQVLHETNVMMKSQKDTLRLKKT